MRRADGLLNATGGNRMRRASVRDFHSFRVTWVTLALTAYVHKTGKDFSRMGGFLFAGTGTLIIHHWRARLRLRAVVQSSSRL